ncbi:MAG: hypothetical protein R2791_03560 [Saprospiraceae bacterium]|nr:hypothetical protein [Saprospiraceae bacterium]MCB9355876.1 hypothetical protein [Lewinellaceae bacterium]
MKKYTAYILGALTILATHGLFQFCVQPPDYPDEPVIEFVSISKNIMQQTPLGPDSILISFNFTDGNGDLGSVSGEPNIFIKDGRDGFDKPPYQIPYIPPQGAGNGISGVISIVVPNTCCIYVDDNGFPLACADVPVPFDTLTYLISIRDQAGHESNQIETPPIGLICK